jgi:hypothetical protein
MVPYPAAEGFSRKLSRPGFLDLETSKPPLTGNQQLHSGKRAILAARLSRQDLDRPGSVDWKK